MCLPAVLTVRAPTADRTGPASPSGSCPGLALKAIARLKTSHQKSPHSAGGETVVNQGLPSRRLDREDSMVSCPHMGLEREGSASAQVLRRSRASGGGRAAWTPGAPVASEAPWADSWQG